MSPKIGNLLPKIGTFNPKFCCRRLVINCQRFVKFPWKKEKQRELQVFAVDDDGGEIVTPHLLTDMSGSKYTI